MFGTRETLRYGLGYLNTFHFSLASNLTINCCCTVWGPFVEIDGHALMEEHPNEIHITFREENALHNIICKYTYSLDIFAYCYIVLQKVSVFDAICSLWHSDPHQVSISVDCRCLI